MSYDRLSFEIRKMQPCEGIVQTELSVLYLLEGEMTVRCFGDPVTLRKEDILLINAGTEFAVVSAAEAVCGRACYPGETVSRIMEGEDLILSADSARDGSRSYSDLRELFREMTAEYILPRHRTRAAMDSMLLKLLDTLIENYRIEAGDLRTEGDESDIRMRQILHYIMNHLHEDLVLSDLASEMYVSASTLSRIFRKKTGVYFADYVMRLRIRNAVSLMRSSDQNLTQIAMNCGFSSSAVFNRSFKKVTGMGPSEYRKKYRTEEDSAAERSLLEEQELKKELLEKGYQISSEEFRKETCVDFDECVPSPVRKVWCECINIGDLHELSRANTQFHVLYLQEQLHFRYVRFWNVFSVKMMISDGKTMGHYNFDLVFQTLDFLVSHHLKPFMDLGRRPDAALSSRGSAVYFEEEYIPFASREIWEDLFTTFLAELTSRYGTEEVSTWIFELCKDGVHDEENLTLYQSENYDFYEVWHFVRQMIREKVPGALFGGTSAILPYDETFLKDFFGKCVRTGDVPDFVSFFLYPYKSGPGEEYGSNSYKPDYTVEKDMVLSMRRFMDETGLGGCRLFITEWNNSIVNRNYLNDSCFRSAYLVSKAAELWEMSDLMAVMAGTDWISSYIDSNRILNGGIGLLSKDSICKPAFYALSFLKNMGSLLYAKGEHFLLTGKPGGGLYLLCFHFSAVRSGMNDIADSTDLTTFRKIRYEEERVLELAFTLKHCPRQGELTVKKRILDSENGSVLDGWSRFGYEAKLNRNDIKYLQAVSVPGIEMGKVRTDENGTLELKIRLKPQEVALLHIY